MPQQWEAQLVAQQLPVANLLDYLDHSQAILQWVGSTPEEHATCWHLVSSAVCLPSPKKVAAIRGAQGRQHHRPIGAGVVHHLANGGMADGSSETSQDNLTAFCGTESTPPPLPHSDLILPLLLHTHQPFIHPCTMETGGQFPQKPVSQAQALIPPVFPSVSVSFSPTVGDSRGTGIGVRLGLMCWHCLEPKYFQDKWYLMEVGEMVWIPDMPQAAPNWTRMYCILGSIQGVTYHTLLDSESNLTSIHQNLAQVEALGTASRMRLRF